MEVTTSDGSGLIVYVYTLLPSCFIDFSCPSPSAPLFCLSLLIEPYCSSTL
jgi:hypothetical protein